MPERIQKEVAVQEEAEGWPGVGMAVLEEEWLQAQRMALQQRRVDHQEECESGWCPERRPHRFEAMGYNWVLEAKRRRGWLLRQQQ